MEDERLLALERKVDWLIQWASSLDPLVKLAHSLASRPSVKMATKFGKVAK